MKTGNFLYVGLVIFISTFAISCNKDHETVPSACSDTVPTDEMCAAYFTRWFYIPQADSCRQISYSGCSQRGFATLTECEACDDDKVNQD